jgi:hypothetical protein
MQREAFMDKAFWWVAGAVVVVIAAAGIYYYRSHKSAPPPLVQQAAPAPITGVEPAIRHPIPVGAATDEPAPPELSESDGSMRDTLAGVFGAKALQQFLVPQNIIRHIVVTVDNLPRKKVAVELRPIKPTAGMTLTGGSEDALTLGPENYARFAPLVQLVRAADTKQLMRVYFHFYPDFQQAYENLGYPAQYFNDRLVEVIDDLLKTPDVTGPIALVQPKVFYEYKDRDLEARSAGQKLLIRMGPENAQVIKAKLLEVRSAVIGHEKALPKHG